MDFLDASTFEATERFGLVDGTSRLKFSVQRDWGEPLSYFFSRRKPCWDEYSGGFGPRGYIPYETADMTSYYIGSCEGRRTLAKTKRNGEIVLLMEAVEKNQSVVWDHIDVAETIEQETAAENVEGYTEKDGSRYVLVTLDAAVAEKLMQITELKSGMKVKVGAHPTFNTTRCVISCQDIDGVEESVLLKRFAPQGVVGVHRITRRGEKGGKVDTTSVVLTCEGTSFPETIKFGLLRIRTRAYYELPLQCHNCYGYGHGRTKCKNKLRCRVCSKVHPITEKCRAKAFCSNCRGNHQPTSRKCPTYIKEVEILKLKTDLGVSYGEARRVYNKEKGAKSYAAVAETVPQVSTAAANEASANNAAPQGSQASSSQQKRKKKRKAKKSKSKGKGKDGVPPTSEVPPAPSGGTETDPGVLNADGVVPAVGPVTHNASTNTTPSRSTGRVDDRPAPQTTSDGVGLFSMPDARPSDAMEIQLLQKKVDALKAEKSQYVSKCKMLKEANVRLEQENTLLTGKLEEAGVRGDSGGDTAAKTPFTRASKRKAIAVLDANLTPRAPKSSRKVEFPPSSMPADSDPGRLGDDVTG